MRGAGIFTAGLEICISFVLASSLLGSFIHLLAGSLVFLKLPLICRFFLASVLHYPLELPVLSFVAHAV